MWAGSSMKLFLGCALLTSLRAEAQGWPIKTIDLSNRGRNCDTSTEQYLQVEGYDFHDHPKFTMRWRQLTGPCGEALPDSELLSWETFYDSTDGDSAPNTRAGRVQLNLFLCCPFGDYELDLVVESYSDEGSSLQQRTAWEIENGPDEYHIWDTINTYLADDEDYSPTVPGTYTWPLQGETGYYKTLYAGTLPPIQCASSIPSGTAYVGCFEDSGNNRLFDSDSMELDEIGTDGMTNHICSDFCSGSDYFGLRSGSQCYCGTAAEFNGAVISDDCGTNYGSLCTGDSTSACGGQSAISVYERTGDGGNSPAPAPVDNVTPTADSYSILGCFSDSNDNRVMVRQPTDMDMTAEVCFGLCNDGTNTHFSTQFAAECWCAVDPDLTKNGGELDIDACNYDCTGSSTGEKCGGRDVLTAYIIDDAGK